MEFEQIKNEVEKVLTPKRFKHSCGVAKRAKELAKIYGLDEKKAEIVGMAHDIAKDMPYSEAIKYIKDNAIEMDDVEKDEPGLWHSKIGAYMCENKFGFSKNMVQAIKYHTTGNVNMNEFDKIIYLADKTEENRKYEDLQKAVSISNEDLDKAMLYVAKVSINRCLERNILVHPDTINLINYIIRNDRIKEKNK